MNEAILHKSKNLRISALTDEDSVTRKFVFVNEDSSAHDISTYDFELVVRTKPRGTILFTLSIGSGLTVAGVDSNELEIYLEESLATIREGSYYYQFRSVTENNTWLKGDFVFDNKKSDKVTDETIIISTGSEVVQITVSGGGSTAGAWIDCGDYDASSTVFPSTGGTGSGGSIKRYNNFLVTTPGEIFGVYLAAGAILLAQQDNPDDDYSITGWKVI